MSFLKFLPGLISLDRTAGCSFLKKILGKDSNIIISYNKYCIYFYLHGTEPQLIASLFLVLNLGKLLYIVEEKKDVFKLQQLITFY